jgi:hypothetical protein
MAGAAADEARTSLASLVDPRDPAMLRPVIEVAAAVAVITAASFRVLAFELSGISG